MANRRRKPIQQRSRDTVEVIIEAATRVFAREGWHATTNRVAEEAGVSIGSLYEYFSNKQDLLTEIARRHLALATSELDAALSPEWSTPELVEKIQSALLASQLYPSIALEHVHEQSAAAGELSSQAGELRARVLAKLSQVASSTGLAEPEQRALAVFDVIGRLSCEAMFQRSEDLAILARHYRTMAVSLLSPEGKPYADARSAVQTASPGGKDS